MGARIVFDLDGTLIDSAPDLHAIANGILAREGAAPITLAEARSYIGNGPPVFIEKMRAARSIPDSEQDRLLRQFLDAYEGAVALTEPYPGVCESLEALRAAGHRLGICTNKPMRPSLAVLEHLGLARFFDTVFGGDSLSVRKPDPTPLREAFNALPAGPEIYVGDSEVDAETARRAAVPFVLFSGGYRKKPLDALPNAGVFDHHRELPDVLEALISSA